MVWILFALLVAQLTIYIYSGEEKPSCLNCQGQNEPCDYSLRLNWGGRARRRSSVGSPGSQSGSLSFSFPLSPLALSQEYSTGAVRRFKPSGLEENTAQDVPASALLWEAGHAGGISIGRAYPSRLHDIQDSATVPDQSLNQPTCTTDRAPVDMDLSREGVPENPVPNSFGAPHYHAPLNTGSSISALLNFNLPSGPVSQPISFMRPSIDVPGYAVNQSSGLPDYQNLSGSPPVDVGPTGVSDSPSDSHGTLSPRSLDTSVFTSSTPGDQKDSPDMFLPGFIDGRPGTAPDRAKHARSDSFCARLRNSRVTFDEYRSLTNSEKWHAYLTSVTDHYGMDCGRPDMDLGNNDDHSAINVNDALGTLQSKTSKVSSPETTQTENGHDRTSGYKYDYYASPVAINIPRYLSPLPPSLVHVPINLMYFHHFLNHTARVLVTHDCGDNPFSSVLPSSKHFCLYRLRITVY